MKVTSVNKRVQYLIELKQLTSSKFADEIGVIRSSISHIISGRNKPGLELLQKILNRYEEINPEWLIIGKGEVFRNRPPKSEIKQESSGYSSKQLSLLDYSDEELEQIKKAAGIESSRVKKEEGGFKSNPANQHSEVDKKEGSIQLPKEKKDVNRITIYFSDNTFKDFFPK